MAHPDHFVKLSEEDFIREVIDIVTKAKEKNIVLRIIGALAVRLYAENDHEAISVHRKRFGNTTVVFTDLDLIGYSKQRGNIEKFFSSIQYQPDRMINRLFGDRRLIFYHPKGHFSVDIFFDKLEFSHDVKFGDKPGSGRLELSFPSITPTDLILEKLQIHQINRKDLVDLLVMLKLKEVGTSEGTINGSYIAKILAQNWGFWYDATNNLQLVKQISEEMLANGDITQAFYSKAVQQLNTLLEFIENEQKSKDWIKRSQIGTKKPWYREVNDIF
jgi:hypothetical protein